MGKIEWEKGSEKRGQAILNFTWIVLTYPQQRKPLETRAQWKAVAESAIISGFSSCSERFQRDAFS
jgi:hypothetical protein